MDATCLAKLAELEEWLALGFYEAELSGLPWPVNYAKALRKLYENMSIPVPEDKTVFPWAPAPSSRSLAGDTLWHANSMILNFNHHCGLYVEQGMVEWKKSRRPDLASFIDEFAADLRLKTRHFGGYTHSNPDIRRVVDEGFLAMEAELDQELAAVMAQGAAAAAGELSFLQALKEYCAGVKTLHARTLGAIRAAAAKAGGVRQARLECVANAFAHCFLWKSESFLEGLLAVNMTWMLDACDSIGLFDQTLAPLFEKDVAAGRLDVHFARELLDEEWRSFEEYNGWNLQIGGRRSDGADGCTSFTRECLRACGRNRFRRPNVAFRITGDTPDSYLIDALQALALGSGRPPLYNDDLYLKTLLAMDLGLNERDVRDMGFGGCTETMIAGMSNVGSLEGTINMAKALELALNDGVNPVSKKQEGPHSGRFEDCGSFAEFLAAFKSQVHTMTEDYAARANAQLTKRFTAGDPKLYRSFFTRDCVKKHRSFEAGGARYNWAVTSYQGLTNAIDSLAAIKRLVFDERRVTAAELLAALSSDFAGQENLRLALLAAPKFGNDLPDVDVIGRDIAEHAWQELYSHATPRGGRHVASCILFTTYLGAGQHVGATPDGRRAFTALNDSIGAVAGRDRRGPTALLKSVTALPLAMAVGTPVLNVRFRKELFKSEDGLDKLVRLIRAYFQQGGLQIQISVLDSKALREAQTDPEKHRDLIVRIGGYSEYFNNLCRDMQDTVIARTEHEA